MCEGVLETPLYRINEPLLGHKEGSLGAPSSSAVPAAAACAGMPGMRDGVRRARCSPGVPEEPLAPRRAILHAARHGGRALAAAPRVAKQSRHSLFSRSVSPSPSSSGGSNTF